MRKSFVIIGEQTLPHVCADYLLSRGHNITAIVSSNITMRQWAYKLSIPTFCSLDAEATDFLKQHNYDYLMSIDNEYYLSETLRQTAKSLAINYHNSLLPKYAGLNVSTWVILNDESWHGVTWHVVEESYDTGDILVQKSFQVLHSDTALSLNLKCYENAINSFKELVSAIELNKILKVKQDSSRRTYFPFSKIPQNNGLLDLTSSAEEIFRMFRALHYGNFYNEVAQPKLYLGSYMYCVLGLNILASKSCHESGVVICCNDKEIIVSTKTQDISITKLMTMLGDQPLISEVSRENNLCVGESIAVISEKFLHRYLKKSKLSKKFQKFWVTEFSNIRGANWPYQIGNYGSKNFQEIGSTSPGELLNQQTNPLLTCVISILYTLYFINGEKNFIAWYRHQEAEINSLNVKGLLVTDYPINTDINDNETLVSSIRKITNQLQNISSSAYLCQELIITNPDIKPLSLDKTILISTQKREHSLKQCEQYKIIFHIDPDTYQIDLVVNEALLSNKTDSLLLKNHLKYILNILYQITIAKVSYVKDLTLVCHESERETLAPTFVKEVNSNETIANNLFIFMIGNVTMRLGSVAIVENNREYTFREFIRDVEQVSDLIIKNIGSTQSFVPFIFERSYEMLVCLFAIIKSGHAYVPIDINYPPDRIDYIVNHSGAKVVLTKSSFNFKLNNSATKKTSINIRNGFSFDIHSNILSTLSEKYELRNLAYLIYTSGTTGRPKGVMVTKKNLYNYASWFHKEFDLGFNSIVDFSSSIAFDISVPCTVVPLIYGAKVVICSQKTKRSPEEYLAHISSNKITHVECTPSQMNMLLFYPDKVKALQSLEWLLLGAENLVKSDVLRWFNLNSSHTLVNEYGPTECTVGVSSFLITNNFLKESQSDRIPIGKASSNNCFYVLNEKKQLCPIGVPGQLFVSGKSVTDGYLNCAQDIKKCFTKIHINGKEITCYATGDLVRWCYDRNVEYIGRIDNQCKVLGFRVEPDEISSRLLTHEAISQCKVYVESDKQRHHWIIAYIVISAKLSPTKKELIDFLKKQLPSYMLPNRYYIVDKFPMTINEKLDQSTIKNFIISEITATPTRIEANFTLKEMVSDILDTHFFNDDDNLYDVGLDSLKSLRIINAIESQYKVKLGLLDIIQNATVNALLNCINTYSEILVPETSFNICVSLKDTGIKSPLFLLHPLGGGLFWYSHFAQFISEDRPIIGLQDPGLDHKGRGLFSTFEQMASFYYQEILKAQPSGPYYLAGASFGANLACAISDIFNKNGEKVNFLGLLDGWLHYDYEKINIDYLKNNISGFSRELGQEGVDWSMQRQLNRIKLISNYHQRKIHCPVVLLKAKELLPVFSENHCGDNGWGEVCMDTFHVHYVSGNHETMFNSENIPNLVNVINSYLANTDAQHIYVPQPPLINQPVTAI